MLRDNTPTRRIRGTDKPYLPLWKRHREILAYFDVGASNGPVEAINGRLEHLRGIALGFRNLKHYILRSLIHSGQLQDRINAL